MMTLTLLHSSASITVKAVDHLQNALKDNAVGSLILQSYATLVMSQPQLNFDSLPEATRKQLPPIPKHLEDAKSHARAFLDNVVPKLVQAVSGIISYSNEFAVFSGKVDESLVRWKNDDPKGRTDTLELLKVLKQDLEKRSKAVKDTATLMTAFRDQLFDDAANFNKDATSVNSLLVGDDKTLKVIQEQLSTIDGKIAGAAVGVAVSAYAIVGGAVWIIAGTIATVATAGGAAPLIIAGVAILALGVGGEIASGIALGTLLDMKRNLLTEEAMIRGEVKVLLAIQSYLQQLAAAADVAVKNLNALANGWNFMADALVNIINDVEQSEDPENSQLKASTYIDVTRWEWSDLHKLATDIRQKFFAPQQVKLDELSSESLRKLDESTKKVA